MSYRQLMYALDNISGFTYQDTQDVPLFVSIFCHDVHADEWEYLP